MCKSVQSYEVGWQRRLQSQVWKREEAGCVLASRGAGPGRPEVSGRERTPQTAALELRAPRRVLLRRDPRRACRGRCFSSVELAQIALPALLCPYLWGV